MDKVLPLALVALVACAPEAEPLPEEEAVEQVRALHLRVYDVYDVPLDRDAVWELLQGSFTGEALTREYVEHWTSRVHMEEESIDIDIREVDYTELVVLESEPWGARVDVDWSVGGIVTHQGHQHPRVNQYRAVYTLVPTPDGPRISGTRMRDLRRVRSVLSADDWFDQDVPSSKGGFMDPLDFLDAGLDPSDKQETP